ncbi:MAG: hypothetical protein IKN65_03230 [Clostridia bacterium]|nr:hypothetical protein [Clostridia bacterium]
MLVVKEKLKLRKHYKMQLKIVAMYKYSKIVNTTIKGLVVFMKKWIIVALIIIIFILSVISGFIVKSYINFSENKQEGNQAVLAEDNNKDTVDTSSLDITVSPNAKVILTETYQKCGHTIITKQDAPREIVNLNKEKVKEYYLDWNIDEFNSNEIKLSRKNNGICNEHYIIRESDGFISISCKNDIGEYIFKGLTDISVQYLSEEDLNKLEQGIEVVGRDNLNKFLEDFE